MRITVAFATIFFGYFSAYQKTDKICDMRIMIGFFTVILYTMMLHRGQRSSILIP